MKYHLITNLKAPPMIVEKLIKTLHQELSEDGAVVQIQKGNHHIQVKKENNIRTITYQEDYELARAWYLMSRNEEKEMYEINEQCAFTEFQVMLDCSRNAVMKVDTIKEYVRNLALLGYNRLQLYTEDTLKVKDEPYFGYMRGAYTKEEIQEVDAYCKLFGIELIPCIQTLAHINQITRYASYKEIVDLNDILLVGEEKTYELLEHIVASVADAYTSRKINIGMDEAHMLGLGKYLDEHGYTSRFSLMIQHLKRVQEILKKYGFTPMMWSDMFFRLLSKGAYTIDESKVDMTVLEKIPKDITLLYWDYYSMEYQHYYSNLKMHHKISNQVGFAAGAWKWTGFAPDNDFSQHAGYQSMKACKDANITNFIVTCWGDNGAEASAFSVLPTLYYYAENAYHSDTVLTAKELMNKEQEKFFLILTGYYFEDFMKLDWPNQVLNPGVPSHSNACKYLLYNDVLLGTFDSAVKENTSSEYAKVCQELNKLSQKESLHAYLFQTLADLCDVLEIKASLGKHIYEAYQAKDKTKIELIVYETIPELMDRIARFQTSFRYQWHKENKSFGYEIQVIRMGALKERLQYANEQMASWLKGDIKQIEELEEERLPFAYERITDVSKINCNLWNVIVSPAVIG